MTYLVLFAVVRRTEAYGKSIVWSERNTGIGGCSYVGELYRAV